MKKYIADADGVYEIKHQKMTPEQIAGLLNQQFRFGKRALKKIADYAMREIDSQERIADLERNGSHERLKSTQALVDELRAKLEAAQTPEPPADLVEALAKVIREEWNTDFTWRTTARAAIAYLRPVTWQDVEKKWAEIRYNGACEPSVQDYSALMNWLRAVLPGGEG